MPSVGFKFWLVFHELWRSRKVSFFLDWQCMRRHWSKGSVCMTGVMRVSCTVTRLSRARVTRSVTGPGSNWERERVSGLGSVPPGLMWIKSHASLKLFMIHRQRITAAQWQPGMDRGLNFNSRIHKMLRTFTEVLWRRARGCYFVIKDFNKI